MKAWLVREKGEFCAEVVFAETRGKARALALRTDCCEDANFTDIEVTRMRSADKYSGNGKWHLDWDDPKDRIILVKECGFMCDYDAFDMRYCVLCSAKEYCDKYHDRMKELECRHCIECSKNEIGETVVFCDLWGEWRNVTLGDCFGNCESQEALDGEEEQGK